MQVYFTGEEETFLYGSLIRDQRIEAYWGRLEKYKPFRWIDVFTDKIINGVLKSDNKLQKVLFLFVFMSVLQKELNEFLMT